MTGQRDMPAVAIDKPSCGARDHLHADADYTMHCTRPLGHDGDHAAHGYDDIIPLHTWPPEGADAS